MYNQGSFSYRPAVGCSWLPAAKAEDLSTSSSSCLCGRGSRPSRESSVLHALARLPDRFASRRHSACLGATRVEGLRAATVKDAPRGRARRSSPACEPRAAALAVAPFARLELAGEGRASADPTTDTGCRHRKRRAPSFYRRPSGFRCIALCSKFTCLLSLWWRRGKIGMVEVDKVQL